MKLKLAHIVPYAPYGLMGYFHKELDILFGIDADCIISSLNVGNVMIGAFKPVLKPLDALTDELFNESGFADEEDLHQAIFAQYVPYSYMAKLFAEHYDVFDLIGHGLAVDQFSIKKPTT